MLKLERQQLKAQDETTVKVDALMTMVSDANDGAMSQKFNAFFANKYHDALECYFVLYRGTSPPYTNIHEKMEGVLSDAEWKWLGDFLGHAMSGKHKWAVAPEQVSVSELQCRQCRQVLQIHILRDLL
jgi:hypothetical protein